MVEDVGEVNTLSRTDELISIFLFVGLALLYYATVSGITSSNDGSHYALLRTMVENRTFTLSPFDHFAEGNDIAVTFDGRLFSDRPPGTALLAVPFYLPGPTLIEPLAPLPSRHDADNPRLPYVLMLPVLAGAATAVILYRLQRRLSIHPAAALTAVVFFSLGTIHWKYSTVLFSHALSAFLVVASVYLTLLLTDRFVTGRGWYLLLGLATGSAVVVEYSNLLAVSILLVFWLVRRPQMGWRSLLSGAMLWLAGALLPLLFLAFYNTVNFGAPLTLSYAYAINYPWAGSFATTFNFPLLSGLKAMLWWGEGGGWCGGPPCVNQGLFLLSPVMLLALPGLVLYARRRPSWFLLTTGLFLAYLVLFSTHHTFHGFTADGRYLMPFLGLLVPPLGLTLDWLLSKERRPLVRVVAALGVYGFFFLSLFNQFNHIGTSYNYRLDWADLQIPLAAPANWEYLATTVFPNTANLPLLIAPALILLVLAALWVTFRAAAR
jgi:4-amino-4-deoxy-L-arabinose transferase-like glycosyltransferase